MAHGANDTSGVRFPPPLIPAAVFAVGYAAHRLFPMALLVGPGGAQRAIGWCLGAGGVLLAASAAFLFRSAGTTPNPMKPTTALVIRGPYRLTRNPMYVGLAALYLGGTLLLNSVWPLLGFPAVIALLQTRVIAREEAYLEAKFGDTYRAYRARVRRWI